MTAVPLLTVAELSSERVGRFEGERLFVATGSVDSRGNFTPEIVSYADKPSRADLVVRPGDVCFARMAATDKAFTIGTEAADLILSTGFAALRPDLDRVEPRFLMHWLRTPRFQGQKDRLCTGATQRAITNDKIAQLSVPLPSLREQRRLAAILDRAEDLREQRRRALAMIGTLEKAAFVAFFGDPVANVNRLPQVPLTELGQLERGVSRHRPRNDPRLLGGPYPFVQTGDVANAGSYITTYSYTYSEFGLAQSRLWPVGTLCITIAANIAKTGILTFEACFPDSVVGFTADAATTTYVRVWLGFLQKTLEASAPQSAQKNINLAVLRSLPVPVPDAQLLARFKTVVDEIEKTRTASQRGLVLTERLVSAAQEQAFDVSDPDVAGEAV